MMESTISPVRRGVHPAAYHRPDSGGAKTPRPPPGSIPLMAARPSLPLAAVAAALLLPAPGAQAAPPANDLPSGAAPFAPYTAANGTPVEQQAIAELAEATPDPRLVRCLGDDSFERTVWFVVPAATVASELTVDASGRTLDPIDVAAFVQPEIVAPPPPARQHLPADRRDRPRRGLARRLHRPHARRRPGARLRRARRGGSARD